MEKKHSDGKERKSYRIGVNSAAVALLNLTFQMIFTAAVCFSLYLMNDSISVTNNGNNSYYMWIRGKDLDQSLGVLCY